MNRSAPAVARFILVHTDSTLVRARSIFVRAPPLLVRAGLGICFAVGAPILALGLRAATLPLPDELVPRSAGMSQSLRFIDHDGHLLREVRADDASRAQWASLDQVGADVVRAVLAAEDRRFFEHPGVDPLAVVRAAIADVAARRFVSGASTLTMQLARLLRPHRRNLWGKFNEAALALRIEASLSKEAILEQYLNRAPFGAGVRGIEAASRFWFDKPPAALSVAEAAALASIPRGPGLYAVDRHPDRVVRRRDRILRRMAAAHAISLDQEQRAEQEPLVARTGKGSFGAPHLIAALISKGFAGTRPQEVRTTIRIDMQREAEAAVRTQVSSLADQHVTAGAAIVLENTAGDVLAYVGSPDFRDDSHGGQNDGVRALRQPGSTLKPFVYATAMEKLGWSAATVLPDVELRIPVENGTYSPMNYDERFHGPVRLRDALGNSLNVPAVWATQQLGVDVLLQRLRDVGFVSLSRDPDWYGPALALGDGEVSLLELAEAYSTIARGGVYLPAREVEQIVRDGVAHEVAAVEGRQVIPNDVADIVTDVLADSRARVGAFGEGSPLEFPFEVAAKTGTSKGSRDNWTVGFTREVTVAVWVGNFDGSAMRGTSGVTGAGPLFHQVMEAAMRSRRAAPLRIASSAGSEMTEVQVCPLSGGLPTAACPHAVREWMTPGARAALAPCTLHEVVAIDRRNGFRAGPDCPASVVAEHGFERYEGPLRSWAATTGRPTAPLRFSPLCAGRPIGPSDPKGLRILWPQDGARFVHEPGRPGTLEQLFVRVDSSADAGHVALDVDGRTVARAGAPFVIPWALVAGEHTFVARDEVGGKSRPVRIRVE